VMIQAWACWSNTAASSASSAGSPRAATPRACTTGAG
jgi:hypothetical protein